ncbi:MAG: acyl-CoA dehydrogenase family protein [Actinomycetota bacterium]|nr:acyl-CoA dehydrogenase family protein [Actinomycetota bacterium]
MHLSDEERDELRDSARKFLDNELGSGRVRSLLDDPDGLDRTAWATIAGLGWAAILVPEEHGGMGASWAEMAVILHEVGRRVAPLPLLSSAVLGVEALVGGSSDTLRAAWLPDVAAGERILTVAAMGPTGSVVASELGAVLTTSGGLRLNGSARFVPDAHIADGIIVAARDAQGAMSYVLVEPSAAGVSVEVEQTVDQTRRLAWVRFDDVAVSESALLVEPGTADALHARVTAAGAVAVCADAVGAAEQMLFTSSKYAVERHQFGRPIGSFQAVKHHCANMLIAVEASRAAVAFAVDGLDDPSIGVAEAAAVAKSFVGPACADACQLAVQVHGGIGFTWEHDAHLYLKRTKLDESLYGSTAWHRRRLGRQILAG